MENTVSLFKVTVTAQSSQQTFLTPELVAAAVQQKCKGEGTQTEEKKKPKCQGCLKNVSAAVLQECYYGVVPWVR